MPTLPDLHQDPLHPLHIYAGHLNADPGAAKLPDTTVTAHLYFVLIKARRTADRERIIFWFNVSITYNPRCSQSSMRSTQGGPGCSSFDGLMMEIGPWRVDGNGGYKVVEGGWEEYTTIVYREYYLFDMCSVSNPLHAVDQPAGTGFSYTSTDRYAHDLTEVCVISRTSLPLPDTFSRSPINSWNFCVTFIPCFQNTEQWMCVCLPIILAAILTRAA